MPLGCGGGGGAGVCSAFSGLNTQLLLAEAGELPSLGEKFGHAEGKMRNCSCSIHDTAVRTPLGCKVEDLLKRKRLIFSTRSALLLGYAAGISAMQEHCKRGKSR